MFAATYFRDAVQLATGDQIHLSMSDKQAVIICEAFTQLVMKRVADTG